jgi:lipopolysaccharide/colanic/teichoic acid biosynthesis glycosyltransferase
MLHSRVRAGAAGAGSITSRGPAVGHLGVARRRHAHSVLRPATAVSMQGACGTAARRDSAAVTLPSDGCLLSEELFRSALMRERKRADRFDSAFALVTVSSHPAARGFAPALPAEVIEALVAATRQTDVVGWLEEGKVLGVSYAEVNTAASTRSEVESRLHRELTRRADSVTLASLQIRWHSHVPPGSAGAEGLSENDPLVEDLRVRQARYSLVDRCKRGVDLAGSTMLLLLLSPLFGVLAALIRLTSPGPVLFRQLRVGHMGRPFTMLKFRTMHAGADHAVHQQYMTEFIRAGAPAAEAAGEKVFKIVNDARITRIGRLLRRTSLDELPQLWNVFRGDMSLVGPRPPLRYELEQYRPWHWRRVLEGKPGLTGLWQVTGRSRTTFDEMVRLDVRYARTRSFWTDIKILLATPRAAVTGKGAA